MKIKSVLKIIVSILVVSFLFGCTKKNDNNQKSNELYIYSVNDFHGSIESTNNQNGIARMAGYIKTQIAESNSSSLILSAGDMFQGSALSNYSKGQCVVDMMNTIGFDAMTLGNHEFDWGIETIMNYQDEVLDNGEANFPFLGCNIVLKGTTTLIPYLKPYTIIEKNDVKIGIIGYIGYGLEEDIATEMVADYEFLEPVNCVATYAKTLREEQNCNIVIAMGHDGDNMTNRKLAKLNDNSRIDAIINGHTHASYVDEYRRDDGIKIPCIQSGTAGNYVGVIKLSLDEKTNEITGSTAYNKKMSSNIEEDEVIKSMVDLVVADTAHIFKRVLCTTGKTINQLNGCQWAVNTLQDEMNVDVAFINTGGIRSNAFPINQGEQVDVAKVYEIMPFDNTIKVVLLKGKQLCSMFESNELCYSANITGNSSSGYYLNEVLIDDNQYYKVAAVDYIFDQSKYPFNRGEEIEVTGILFRDILISKLEQIGQSGSTWVG